MNIEMKSIGIVRSPIKEEVDTNWGNVISEIHVSTEYIPGLKGLNDFSNLLVLFYMHKSTFDPKHDLVRRPRGRDDMPLIGIFAQRAKHRPNPIGVTVVKLIDVKEGVLVVKGLDAIEGTPVVDIKPYVPVFDDTNDVVVPEWIKIIMKDYF